jgi:hypothetical protein
MRRFSWIAVAAVVAVAVISQSLPSFAATGNPPSSSPNTEAITQIDRALSGVVLAWEDGRIVRVGGAHIGTGLDTVQADGSGRFHIPAAIRTDRLNVVAPGYNVVRRQSTADYEVVFLRPVDVRAIYLPYDLLKNQSTLDWIVGLARAGTISALVVDVKEEGGRMLPIVANNTARQIGAVRDPGTNIQAFLNQLKALDVYRIARVVTFLDGSLAFGRPEAALRTVNGEIVVDSIGLAWTDPTSEVTKRHNIEIGVNAAAHFEEVQYDYVRLPTDPGVLLRNTTTSAQRSAFIAGFAGEAAEALHAVGAAIAVDTFGLTAIVTNDAGIGQILEDIGPKLDYFSPMVYPSTWTPGWFDLAYPPANPNRVVFNSVASAVARLEAISANTVVRPWLQDFQDYQERKLFYGAEEVRVQIEASDRAGGQGFMLWDPSLNYQIELLSSMNQAAR